MTTQPIHDFLARYAGGGGFRVHMPGHKGRLNPFDITEIDGADVLHNSGGIILESERNAAALFGAAETLYSCSGATLAIQAMLTLAKRAGYDTVYAVRGCHASVIRACILLSLDVISISGAEEVTRRYPVIITTADYYGGVVTNAALMQYRTRTPLLLADNSHGTYRVFTPEAHPLRVADMVADSGHKTLPVLTGGAYLHISGDCNVPAVTRDNAKEAMSLFASTSPSYLILDSLDTCNRFIAEERDTALRAFAQVAQVKAAFARLGYTVAEADSLLHVTLRGDGYAMAGQLRERGIEPEMVEPGAVVLLFGACDADLGGLIAELPPCPAEACDYGGGGGGNQDGADDSLTRVMSPREAYFAKSEVVDTRAAAGRVCAGIDCPVPPCRPVVLPGERISEHTVAELLSYGVARMLVTSVPLDPIREIHGF